MRAGGREYRLGQLVLLTGRPRSELVTWSKEDRVFAYAALRVDQEQRVLLHQSSAEAAQTAVLRALVGGRR